MYRKLKWLVYHILSFILRTQATLQHILQPPTSVGSPQLTAIVQETMSLLHFQLEVENL